MNSKTLKEFYNLWVKPIIKNPVSTGLMLGGTLFGVNSLLNKSYSQSNTGANTIIDSANVQQTDNLDSLFNPLFNSLYYSIEKDSNDNYLIRVVSPNNNPRNTRNNGILERGCTAGEIFLKLNDYSIEDSILKEIALATFNTFKKDTNNTLKLEDITIDSLNFDISHKNPSIFKEGTVSRNGTFLLYNKDNENDPNLSTYLVIPKNIAQGILNQLTLTPVISDTMGFARAISGLDSIGQTVLPDTTRRDTSIAIADTIINRGSPIVEFTDKYKNITTNVLKQAKTLSKLTGIVYSLNDLAGDPNYLDDDNNTGIKSKINEFKTVYNQLPDTIFNDVADSLSDIINLRKEFAGQYSRILNGIKAKYKGDIEDLEDIIKINEQVNENLKNFQDVSLTKLTLALYDSSFKHLTLKENILIEENKELKKFIDYLSKSSEDSINNFKSQRKSVIKTGVGEEIINIQNEDLGTIGNYFLSKRNVLSNALADRLPIRNKNTELVKKQIRYIDELLEKINNITGTEYKRTSKKPKVKHEKPNISFLNGVEFGTLYSQSGVKGQILNTDLGDNTPLVGLKLFSYGDISSTLGVGYKTAINTGETITYGNADLITGITPSSKHTWNDGGSYQAGFIDFSFPITENLGFNVGALGTSEDHNISGKVKEYISVPGITNPILTNTYDYAPEKFVGNKIFGTIGAGLNLGKFDAKAEAVFRKHENPGYKVIIGYKR